MKWWKIFTPIVYRFLIPANLLPSFLVLIRYALVGKIGTYCAGRERWIFFFVILPRFHRDQLNKLKCLLNH